MPHHAVTGRRPIKRCRRGHASVGPAILVHYGYRLAFMRKSAVLHSAAVEIFHRHLTERYTGAPLVENHGSSLLQHRLVALTVYHRHARGELVYSDLHLGRGNGKESVSIAYL